MKNSVQKITEQAKTRDTRGRFKVAMVDLTDSSAIDFCNLLEKVQLFYSQDNKDKTTQIILMGVDSKMLVLDFRLKSVRPLGTGEHWDKQMLIDYELGRIQQDEQNLAILKNSINNEKRIKEEDANDK